MRHNRKLDDEQGRLAALRRYNVLDTPREEPFDKLTQLVCEVLGVPIAAVSLIDADRQWFRSISGLSACQTTREVSFCTHTIKRREPLVVPDTALDLRFAKNPFVTGEPRIRSYLGVPLETPDGYNLGALCAIDTKPRSFDPAQIEILKSFARLVLNELELRQIAMSDSLTGAMTRRGWMEAAANEVARCRRHGAAASIIFFDIDHFKAINDRYGHPAGDAVLRVLTQRSLAEMRNSDVLGRIGGEEFAVLLPETNAEGALDLAERLRRRFAETTVEATGIHLRVTASFGVSHLIRANDSVETWMAKADEQLYAAKAKGRNRCCGANSTKEDGVDASAIL